MDPPLPNHLLLEEMKKADAEDEARALQQRLLVAGAQARRQSTETGPGPDSALPPADLPASASLPSSSSSTSNSARPAGAYLKRQSKLVRDVWSTSRSMPGCSLCLDYPRTVDIFIKAIMIGWKDAILSYSEPCDHWPLFRILDEQYLCPNGTGRTERFAMLMALLSLPELYNRYIDREECWFQRPWWQKPRPSQKRIPHDMAIDFLPWPTLRERLVFECSTGLTDTFHREFLSNLSFYWRHELSEGFFFNSKTALYETTAEMDACLRDLNHWRMRDAFLTHFPSFRDDVLLVSKLPEDIMLWTMPSALQKKEYRATGDGNAATAGAGGQTASGQRETNPQPRPLLPALPTQGQAPPTPDSYGGLAPQ